MLARVLLASAVVAMAAAVCAAPARAEDEEEGKRRFLKGLELYEAEQYLEAAAEFEAGYAAAPRPAFLLNIGHSYRRAGELEKAKANYELLLQLEPDFGKRDEVEAAIAEIDEELATQAEPDAEPDAEQEPVDDAVAPVPATGEEFEFARPEVLTLEEAQGPQAKEEDDSIFSSGWFWLAVGVVAVGGAVAAVTLTGGDEGCPGDVCFVEMP